MQLISVRLSTSQQKPSMFQPNLMKNVRQGSSNSRFLWTQGFFRLTSLTLQKLVKYAKENRFPSQGSYRNRKSKFKDFSRTFQGLFTFSRSHFSWTVTHLTLLIRRISVPFKIVNAFPFRAHCFCLISALCIVSARYFRFCLSRFPLCKVSLPVAFDSYYLNQIE